MYEAINNLTNVSQTVACDSYPTNIEYSNVTSLVHYTFVSYIQK
jgi:hypothetical protein